MGGNVCIGNILGGIVLLHQKQMGGKCPGRNCPPFVANRIIIKYNIILIKFDIGNRV